MKLVESILTKNPCYTAGRKIAVKGLMLHSVGCSQPSAAVFIRNWNKESYDRACVHGFIDGNDGTVYQTLPWDHRGWHCGSGSNGSGNNTHIGVEMCEPACIKYTGGASFTCSDTATAKAVAERTYRAAVELFAMLCRKFSLDPLADGVVISHKEGHKRGIASNHGDPEHLWNQLGTGYTMDTFRAAVKKELTKETASEPPAEQTPAVPAEHPDKLTGGYYRVRKTWKDSKSQLGAYKVLKYAKAKADANPGYFVFDPNGTAFYPASAPVQETPTVSVPFLVKVKISDLNIRKGPGTDYARTGRFTGAGVFTIVEVRSGKGSTAGWGRLKSGAGWISLDYATKL